MKVIWSTLRELLPLLPFGARRFLAGYVVATVFVTGLDVVSMTLLAVIIGPAISGGAVSLPFVGVVDSGVVPFVVFFSLVLIIVKSLLGFLMHWVTTRRFSRYEKELGDRFFAAYINSSWEERSKRSAPEVTRIADAGIANTIAGFVLPLTRVPSFVLTFVAVLGVLVVVEPVTSLIALCYLSVVAFLVNRVVTRRALEAGRVNLDFSYRIANLMTEMIDALKELTLRGKLDEVAGLVGRNRERAVRARANGTILSFLPGFSFEAALIGGVMLVGASSFLQSGMQAALASVALFAATGFRLIPALTGLQGSFVQASASSSFAQDVVTDLTSTARDMQVSRVPEDSAVLPAAPKLLSLRDVSFTYAGASSSVLSDLNLDVPLGSSVGVVGPSGAGKSTLVDVLLGLSEPCGGSVLIDGVPLRHVLRAWRSRVGYVPQRVALFAGSIAQNVALSWEGNVDRERVVKALERAQLMSLVAERPSGIDELVGERGVLLSGGQQQRLGIARALYSDPFVLVLDEATSSLDTKTEDEVSRAIRELQGEVTLISVAHRLSTIKDYSQICYLDGGRIVASGSFADVARQHPPFAEQVALAGLQDFLS